MPCLLTPHPLHPSPPNTPSTPQTNPFSPQPPNMKETILVYRLMLSLLTTLPLLPSPLDTPSTEVSVSDVITTNDNGLSYNHSKIKSY